jgi:hypothetical protein
MGNILDDLERSVSNTWNQVTAVGVPAVVAAAEGYASEQLAGQARQSQAQAQAAVNQAVSAPGPSSGIMASIQKTFSQLGVGAAAKQYGVYMILGGVAMYFIIKKVL